jgi:hypothetical protein
MALLAEQPILPFFTFYYLRSKAVKPVGVSASSSSKSWIYFLVWNRKNKTVFLLAVI